MNDLPQVEMPKRGLKRIPVVDIVEIVSKVDKTSSMFYVAGKLKHEGVKLMAQGRAVKYKGGYAVELYKKQFDAILDPDNIKGYDSYREEVLSQPFFPLRELDLPTYTKRTWIKKARQGEAIPALPIEIDQQRSRHLTYIAGFVEYEDEMYAVTSYKAHRENGTKYIRLSPARIPSPFYYDIFFTGMISGKGRLVLDQKALRKVRKKNGERVITVDEDMLELRV